MQSAGLRRLLHTGGCLRSTDVASLKVLRERTGLGIGLCKKALASGGSVNGALEWLSDNEHVQADKLKAKLHERSTPAGRLGIAVQGNLGVLVEMSCETDFVARNEHFVHLTTEVAGFALERASHLSGALGTVSLDVDDVKNFSPVQSALGIALTSLKENIAVQRATVLRVPEGTVGGYLHDNGAFAALVGVTPGRPGLQEFCAKIAQHVVAVDPAVGGDDPLQTLRDSPYVFNNSKTIQQLIGQAAEEKGTFDLAAYLRWTR